METDINLILVDDHILFRDGLKYVLDQTEHFHIIGEASNGIEFLTLLDKVKPDVTLMDISMPKMNGIEATIKAISKNPELKIIALTMFDDEKYYYDILNAGAKGFILKDSDSEELIKAINSIAHGESYFSSEVLLKIIRSYSANSKADKEKLENKLHLTSREEKVLKLICKGMTNKEIAEKISLNQRSVESIRYNLLNKTNSSNSLNLAIYAIENNLVD